MQRSDYVSGSSSFNVILSYLILCYLFYVLSVMGWNAKVCAYNTVALLLGTGTILDLCSKGVKTNPTFTVPTCLKRKSWFYQEKRKITRFIVYSSDPGRSNSLHSAYHQQYRHSFLPLTTTHIYINTLKCKICSAHSKFQSWKPNWRVVGFWF